MISPTSLMNSGRTQERCRVGAPLGLLFGYGMSNALSSLASQTWPTLPDLQTSTDFRSNMAKSVLWAGGTVEITDEAAAFLMWKEGSPKWAEEAHVWFEGQKWAKSYNRAVRSGHSRHHRRTAPSAGLGQQKKNEHYLLLSKRERSN